MLQSIVVKLLGQSCSSSSTERNWSTCSFIYCLKRNKISPKRAKDLVFIYSNLRLLSRKRDEYTEAKSQKWDTSGDSWDEPFRESGLLEIAFLSLDELELEVMLVENDEETVEEDDVMWSSLSCLLFFCFFVWYWM